MEHSNLFEVSLVVVAGRQCMIVVEIVSLRLDESIPAVAEDSDLKHRTDWIVCLGVIEYRGFELLRIDFEEFENQEEQNKSVFVDCRVPVLEVGQVEVEGSPADLVLAGQVLFDRIASDDLVKMHQGDDY